MTVKDVMYKICEVQGISLSQAAENIGMTQGALWSILHRNNGQNVKIDALVRYFDGLGCEVIIRENETDEEFILDGEDEDILIHTGKFSGKKDNSW